MSEAVGEPNYVLAASGREAEEFARLDLLQQIFDPVTAQRLDFVQCGWRCLEVGAGRGSIAKLISDKIGDQGEIIATDIDLAPSSSASLPNGRFISHNILVDPLDVLGGPGSFDLVHARFFIQHVYAHEDLAIRRMVDLLKPGGWLVIEDLDAATMAASDPDHPLAAGYDQVLSGSVAAMRAAKIVDPAPGRALPPRFVKAGLINMRHDGRIYVDHGGSPMARWYVQSTRGSRRGFDDKGMAAAVDVTIQALSDPTFWFQSGAFHCAWGQKPG
jgi:predicted O-methyltransferase YrrM